jgi:hypothetical protein
MIEGNCINYIKRAVAKREEIVWDDFQDITP